VTPLAPAGAGLALVVLRRTKFAPRWVAAALILLPFIVLAAPAKAELAATILIEAPVVYALSLALRTDAVRLLIASGFVNALTQPLLYLALRHFASADHWWANFLFLEAVVWAAEALLYLACVPGLWRMERGTSKAFAVSLAANAASALIGLAAPI
jgi:hypothetical protein